MDKILSNLSSCSEHDLKLAQTEAAKRLKMPHRKIKEAWASMGHESLQKQTDSTHHHSTEDPVTHAVDVEIHSIRRTINTEGSSTTSIPHSEETVNTSLRGEMLSSQPVAGMSKNKTTSGDNEITKRKPTSPVSDNTRQLNKKQHVDIENSPTSDILPATHDDCIVHPSKGNSSKWQIAPIPQDFEAVVLGDSTLTSWERIPKCYMQSFPGAHIVDIAKMITCWDIPRHITKIIIAVGVNNHIKTEVQNKKELMELFESLRNIPLHVQKYFVQIAISPLHTPPAVTRLEALNKMAQNEFDEDHYIPFVREMTFTDKQHFDAETGNRLSEWIQCFLC